MLAKQLEYLAEARSPASCSVRACRSFSQAARTRLGAARLMRDSAAVRASQAGPQHERRHSCFECRSSSIKFALFRGPWAGVRKGLLCEGACEGIGHPVHFTAKDRRGRLWPISIWRRSTMRMPGGSSRLAGSPLSRPSPGGGRPSGRAWRDALYRAGAYRRGGYRRAPRLIPLAPLHQPHHLGRHRGALEAPSDAAADRLLRHLFPSIHRRRSPSLRAAAPAARRRHPPVRISRSLLRIYRQRAAGCSWLEAAEARRRRPPRQRRQHVRDAPAARALRRPWASRRSTGCR